MVKRQKLDEASHEKVTIAQAEAEGAGGSRRKKKMLKVAQPFAEPFYKGIQLPPHLKWITVNAVSLLITSTRVYIEIERVGLVIRDSSTRQ